MAIIWMDNAWLDRDAAKVSVFDHGLLYGDGVFEGIRAYGGRVFRLAEHLALSGVSLLAGLIIALPLGLYIGRTWIGSTTRPARLP